MGELIGELVLELVLAPLVQFLLGVLWLVGRTLVLLSLYPVMLLAGWLRLWLRARGRLSLGALWRAHGPAGLHRFGWQAAALDLHYLVAMLLLALAGLGIGLLVYCGGLALLR
ncbi:MAG: hypothetical protein ACRYF0_13035 [Janthinobacterium lividum]